MERDERDERYEAGWRGMSEMSGMERDERYEAGWSGSGMEGDEWYGGDGAK